MASLAVQIHGGHGFIRQTGVEQLLRDARITPIYEGTNGIQALDLLGRKVFGTGGKSQQVIAARMLRIDRGSAPCRNSRRLRRISRDGSTAGMQLTDGTGAVGHEECR